MLVAIIDNPRICRTVELTKLQCFPLLLNYCEAMNYLEGQKQNGDRGRRKQRLLNLMGELCYFFLIRTKAWKQEATSTGGRKGMSKNLIALIEKRPIVPIHKAHLSRFLNRD